MSKRSAIRNKLDKIVSQIVRARGYCVWCGNKDESKLQCCHIYSRSNLQTRWHLPNLLCLCASCHFRGHKQPTEFAFFVVRFLGEPAYEELRKRANETKVFANYELEEMYERFKEIIATTKP